MSKTAISRRDGRARRVLGSTIALSALIGVGTVAVLGAAGEIRAQSGAADPSDVRMRHDWPSHGLDPEETRYSPLAQIASGNVAKLGLAWAYDLDTHRGQEATPLVVDGVIYSSSAWSKVQAIDGVSGRLLWQFDPKVSGEAAVKGCCDVINRGVAYWRGRVFVGTFDGRLIALDAVTGKVLWSVVTVDQSLDYTISGAPRIVEGRVIIGNGGAEYGVRGYVSAYDAVTGQLAWRFYTVPPKPGQVDHAVSDPVLAKAAQTWSPEALARGPSGGTAWDSFAYDPQLRLLYIGVGNYWPNHRDGPAGNGRNDNLFVGSVVAVKADTGEYVWHYQETPDDKWDYTSTQHMILTDLVIDGQNRKVLLHAPKNGYFYVIDRTNGKLLGAKPYGPMNWSSGIDMATGRPHINPESDYIKTGKGWLAQPGPNGDHDWQPMSFSRQTGLVYIPVNISPMVYTFDQNYKPLRTGVKLALSNLVAPPIDAASLKAARESIKGYILAWDPVSQREAWRADNPGGWNGGLLSTGGDLVFQGDQDGRFNAYDARDGRKLWSFDAQSTIIAAPVTWSKDGVQYVTVLAGWGGSVALGGGAYYWSDDGPRVNRSRVLTFRLGGDARLPPVVPAPKRVPLELTQFADPQTVADGRNAYYRTCFACHGGEALSGGIVPDLRFSPTLKSKVAWHAIVADGALTARGMVGFKADFSDEQIDAIRAYVVDRALATRGLGN